MSQSRGKFILDATEQRTLVEFPHALSPGFYRVHNFGKVLLQVFPDNGLKEIEPGNSLDVWVNGKLAVQAKNAAGCISGWYERLR